MGSSNGLIHFTLIPMGKKVSVYERPSGTNQVREPRFDSIHILLTVIMNTQNKQHYEKYIRLYDKNNKWLQHNTKCEFL